jgi:hypothetical protein
MAKPAKMTMSRSRLFVKSVITKRKRLRQPNGWEMESHIVRPGFSRGAASKMLSILHRLPYFR